jgi:hypothetical protein
MKIWTVESFLDVLRKHNDDAHICICLEDEGMAVIDGWFNVQKIVEALNAGETPSTSAEGRTL